jgi:hypothetical protein
LKLAKGCERMAHPGASARVRSGGKAPFRRSGTPRAILAEAESGAAVPAFPTAPTKQTAGKPTRSPGKGWGGARNRADRTSDRITSAAARNILAAAEHASRIGLPLNRFLTVHWERAGVPERDAAAATTSFLKAAGDWLRWRGLGFVWIYSRETGPGKGSHVHLAMHVPPAVRASFVRQQRLWVKLAAGRYVPGVQHSRPIGGTLAIANGGGPIWAQEVAYALGYILKGVTATDARALALQRRPRRGGDPPNDWGESGRIIGKRAGFSQNIGPAMRLKAIPYGG